MPDQSKAPKKIAGLSLGGIAFRSLRFFFKPHAALAAGVAAATAVIVGALVVGDSVRGSLRDLVIQRLGNTDCLLHARVFFDPGMFDELQIEDSGTTIAPGILFSSTTLEKRSDGRVARASKVQVLAFGPEFWESAQLGSSDAGLNADEVILNRSLADELNVSVGDEISVRIGQVSSVAGDNPLGKREDDSVNVPRQKVVAIAEDRSLGGISFLAGQSAPRNVFASLETLQDVLECGPQVNAALVLRPPEQGDTTSHGQTLCDQLNLQLRPELEDYGLTLERHRRVFPEADLDEPAVEGLPPEVVFDYFQLSSKELVLDNQTSRAVVLGVGRSKAIRHMTYLANSMAKVAPTSGDLAPNRSAAAFENMITDDLQVRRQNGPSMVGVSIGEVDPGIRPSATIGRELSELTGDSIRGTRDEPNELLSRAVPYSVVIGIDRDSELMLQDYLQVPRANLQIPYCWINSWLAEQMDVTAGDWFQADFFQPETVDGREVEKTTRFMIAGVVPITEPIRGFRRRKPAVFSDAPSIFNDPGLTPNVPGVTDQESISNWDLPFKLKNEILPVDDEYWNRHRLTPKVFMPYRYASSTRMFGSRFGNSTAIRFEANRIHEDELRASIEEALLTTRGNKGLRFTAIRQRQLAAASGTTPFDMLFLSLSFFVIVAALILVFLLFKLGIKQRGSELGILLAQGFTPQRIRGLLLRELALVSVVGAGVGILLGIVYARAIVAGLESWWIGAIATKFLSFFVTGKSLFIGTIAGVLASLTAVLLGLRKLNQLNALDVLRGGDLDLPSEKSSRNLAYLACAGFVASGACGLVFAGIGQSGMARAGCFFGSGMLLLIATLIAVHQWIAGSASTEHDPRHGNLWQLAIRGLRRNPLRSSLSLSLLAVASFLIASMSAFQIAPTETGYGGFNLIGESARPIFRNIGSGSVRSEALGDEAKKLLNTTIVPMRARNGEDASCNNLFQVAQPTILGVSDRLRELHHFAPDSIEFSWAATAVESNPWAALATEATGGQVDPIPVILDQNTAAWSLKQGASRDSIIRIEIENRTIFFRTVGLLSNSVLQGKLLISQSNFENLFPEISGYSFFLIRSKKGADPQIVAETMEKGWSNEGLDIKYSSEILAAYLGVQNTYISAFQSLGALGLLLGTFGLIAVQIRSVLERQREFALMRALGFAPSRISRLLTIETAILLFGGLLTGILCSVISLIPFVLEVGPQLSVLYPALMLVSVLAAGFLAGWLAVRAATRLPVLSALRSQ